MGMADPLSLSIASILHTWTIQVHICGISLFNSIRAPLAEIELRPAIALCVAADTNFPLTA
jgi:hypothetical protein